MQFQVNVMAIESSGDPRDDLARLTEAEENGGDLALIEMAGLAEGVNSTDALQALTANLANILTSSNIKDDGNLSFCIMLTPDASASLITSIMDYAQKRGLDIPPLPDHIVSHMTPAHVVSVSDADVADLVTGLEDMLGAARNEDGAIEMPPASPASSDDPEEGGSFL